MLVERARQQVASLLHCRPREVLFTSGGTEADNIAVLGTVRASRKSRKHVITTTIEHPAVLNTCQALEKEGVDVTYVKVGRSGVVSPDDVRAALRPETVLITIMHANNELGTIQPLAEISKIAREAGAIFHTDGVQSAGKIPTAVDELGVDFFSLSAHKLYGPKGAGALYMRKGVEFEPIQFGGSHERSLRPGTENVPGIVGLGAAAELALKSLEKDGPRLAELRDRLERGVLERVELANVNATTSRVPNTTQHSVRTYRGRGDGDRARFARLCGFEWSGMLERRGAPVACADGGRAFPGAREVDAAIFAGQAEYGGAGRRAARSDSGGSGTSAQSLAGRCALSRGDF